MARAIRFRVPEGETRFTDLVHGPIAFDRAHIEDFVILRSDGHPTYHLSVVGDDVEMRITHVVRGDDHISNTPKHVMLFEALGAPVPQFAHVPLILGPDKKRLSKRHGATSVTEYERQGYLADAMVNFLALLGWSPGTNQELFTRDELIAQFTLEGISGGNAVFNQEKLDWMNAQHVARLPDEAIVAADARGSRVARALVAALRGSRRAWLHQAIELVKPRVKKLERLRRAARAVPARARRFRSCGRREASGNGRARRSHRRAGGCVPRRSTPFDVVTTEATLRRLRRSRGVKAGALIHATRVALTGPGGQPRPLRGRGADRPGGHRCTASTARAFPARARSLSRANLLCSFAQVADGRAASGARPRSSERCRRCATVDALRR